MTEDLGLVYAHVVSPPGIEGDLPTVSETWGEFGGGGEGGGGRRRRRPERRRPARHAREPPGRPQQPLRRVDRRRSAQGARPALNFKHALLPHVPWQYLPDGRQYRRTATEPIPEISRQSYKDEGQVEQLQLRHLLQIGFADRELAQDDRPPREQRASTTTR